MNKLYQICTKCVMDTTDPEIEFDENGVCNHCKGYDQIADKLPGHKEIALQKMVTKIKAWGKNKTFDCLLGIGGGLDCSYTAYIAYKHDLRVLLFHMDNGWNTEKADYNIKALSNRTNFPLITHRLNLAEFNDVLLAFMKASVIDIEVATDHACTALLFQLAKEKNIKYLLTGSNIVTESIMPSTWNYRKNDLVSLKAIYREFGSGKLRTFPTMSFLKLLWYKKIEGYHTIPLLNYVDYNRKNAKKILHKFCGWQDYGLKHWESIWTRFYQRYILPHKFGVDKRRAHYSTLICSGQMTREQALHELNKSLYGVGEFEQEKRFVLKGLGLSEQQFDRLMQRPIKSHRKFGSDERLYLFLKKTRNIMRKLGNKLK